MRKILIGLMIVGLIGGIFGADSDLWITQAYDGTAGPVNDDIIEIKNYGASAVTINGSWSIDVCGNISAFQSYLVIDGSGSQALADFTAFGSVNVPASGADGWLFLIPNDLSDADINEASSKLPTGSILVQVATGSFITSTKRLNDGTYQLNNGSVNSSTIDGTALNDNSNYQIADDFNPSTHNPAAPDNWNDSTGGSDAQFGALSSGVTEVSDWQDYIEVISH